MPFFAKVSGTPREVTGQSNNFRRWAETAEIGSWETPEGDHGWGRTMRRSVKVGDVVEISTSRGFAYAQFTHKMPKWGALLGVLPGFHAERPADLRPTIGQRAAFQTFFPLQAAVGRGIFEVVTNLPVPEHAVEFPRFREAGFIDREGRVLDWSIWDGKTSRRLERLTPDLERLPILAVWNDTLLIQRIEEEWTPEKDTR